MLIQVAVVFLSRTGCSLCTLIMNRQHTALALTGSGHYRKCRVREGEVDDENVTLGRRRAAIGGATQKSQRVRLFLMSFIGKSRPAGGFSE